MTLTGLTVTNLSIANNESVVQQSIIGFFQSKRTLLFNRFDGDDGVLFDSNKNSSNPHYVSILFEFKHDTNLLDNQNLAKKLMQSLVYLYRMDNSSDLKTPRVVAIVDKDEFVYFHTNQLVEYLSYDAQWPKKATDAYKTLPEIYNNICDDLLNKKLIPVFVSVLQCKEGVPTLPSPMATRSFTSNFATGELVPIPTLPLESIRARSVTPDPPFVENFM